MEESMKCVEVLESEQKDDQGIKKKKKISENQNLDAKTLTRRHQRDPRKGASKMKGAVFCKYHGHGNHATEEYDNDNGKSKS